jgi:RNA recognition motif-containing protein
VLEPEVAEAVHEQVKHQNVAALADGFAQSAAFFGKKASYAPVQVEAPVEKPEAVKTVGDKKETKKSKKSKKKQQSEDEKESELKEDKEEIDGKDAAENDDAEDGEKKKKKKKHKKKNAEDAEEEQQKADTPDDEKARRTVFVGNVSLDATQKDLKNHFAVCGKVESVRLRHLPIAGCAVGEAGNQKLMMKVCANKKILTTAKDNCNAYVTFAEESSVEAALKLTGTVRTADLCAVQSTGSDCP